MRGLAVTWGVAVAIVSWRSIRVAKRPPMPGALLGVSGLWLALALLAEAQPQIAVLLGVGFDAAALLNLFSLGGPAAPTGTTAAASAKNLTAPPATA